MGDGAGTFGPKMMDETFEFCAPVVGPLSKEEYLGALESFKLTEAFDINSRVYNIHVDPFEFNRVWYMTRPLAKHVGTCFGKEATGKELVQPPQANSFTFNEEGKVTQMTVGYVMDRRVGNTGGLGAAFGYFYGIGKPLPIPECQPYKRSKRFAFLNAINRFLGSMRKD